MDPVATSPRAASPAKSPGATTSASSGDRSASPTVRSKPRGALKKPKEPPQRGVRDDNAVDEDDEDATDYSVAKNDGDEDTIVVMAHVRDKIIPVHCGFGTQQVIWLGHVAIARYDEERNQGWRQLGIPTKMLKDNKDELKLTDLICDVVPTRSHIYITTSLGDNQ